MAKLNAPRLLRALAILIAVLGAIDPAISTDRFARSDVTLIATNSARDSALSAVVRRTLAKSFNVVPAPFAGASASIVVGDALPSVISELAPPLFAVVPEHRGASVFLDAVTAPATAPLNGRVPVRVVARTADANGRSLDVTLRVGELVVDHAVIPVRADSGLSSATLAFVPTTLGTTTVQVTASIVGEAANRAARATAAVDIHDSRWSVLFFDPRPSWMSTFVRRAVEHDPRFVVTSRVVTSRNVTTDAGAPPAGLTDLAALELFDVVVVGAPEALTDRDVAGLETVLRKHAGQVILLLDEPTDGPYRRLLDAGAWRSDSGSKVFTVAPGDSASDAMRATELTWPSRLPLGADVVAHTDSTKGDAAGGRPIVWRAQVGAGQLLVSGALDAWRFRDAATSGFDRFWRTIIADAAAANVAPVAVRISPTAITPQDSALITVTLRDPMLQVDTRPLHLSVAATLEGVAVQPVRVRLWPDNAPGQFRGVVRVAAAGLYRVVVNSGGQRGEAALLVDSQVEHAAPAGGDLLHAWVAARGGEVISESALPGLVGRVRKAIGAAPHREPWHPMRSPWWIVPFALLLGGEWWLRRRSGLA